MVPGTVLVGPGGTTTTTTGGPGLSPNEGADAAAKEDAKRKEEEERLKKQGMMTYEITTITSDMKWVMAGFVWRAAWCPGGGIVVVNLYVVGHSLKCLSSAWYW